jgi:hypothetical protein
MDGYMYHQQMAKEYPGFGFKDKKNVGLLVDSGELDAFENNGTTYYTLKSIIGYVDKMTQFRMSHFSFSEFLAEMGIGNINSNRLQKNIYIFCKAVNINICLLDVPLNGITGFVNKNNYYEFQKEYLSIKDAFEKYSDYGRYEAFIKNVKINGIIIAVLRKGYETMYVREKEIQGVFHKRGAVLTKTDLSRFLDLSYEKLEEVMEENGIEFTKQEIEPFVYIPKVKAIELKEKQEKIYEDLDENYYTSDELEDIGLINKKEIKRISKINIPHLVKKGKFKGKNTGYSKSEIEIILAENMNFEKIKLKSKKNQEEKRTMKEENTSLQEEKRKIKEENKRIREETRNLLRDNASKFKQSKMMKKQVNVLISSMETDPYTTYMAILNIEKMSFNETAKVTEKYWLRYVEEIFNNSNASISTQRKMLRRYKGATQTLIEVTQNKEIIAFSSKELKIAIFNDNVSIERQTLIYSFLNSLNESLKVQGTVGINLQDFKYIQYKRQGKRKISKDIYSFDDYMSIYSYVSEIEMHKTKAIDDVERAINNNGEYNNYDSIWLFVLLHMNNDWRASDFVEFPRVDQHIINSFNLNSLDDYKGLELSANQAERIIKLYEIKYMKHHKNGQERTFFCSKELTLPMAYAILICELRCRLLTPLSRKLVNFSNNEDRMTDKQHRIFFEEHEMPITFASLKMNRTLITFLAQTIKDKTGRNPMELVKYARGHTDSETTNIYVVIPQERLDFLTEQLFNVGYFGYAYDMMASILLGESPESREEKTRRSLEIKDIIGDVSKIENMSNYINYVSRERDDLKKYLEEMPKRELKEKLNLITLSQSPAKDEHYQCLFSDCVKDRVDCKDCQYSIPHFFVLSQVMERIDKKLLKYESIVNDPNMPNGEKRRVSNLLYSDILLLKEAKDKFGEDALSLFLPEEYTDGYSSLRDKIKMIPDPRKYIL